MIQTLFLFLVLVSTYSYGEFVTPAEKGVFQGIDQIQDFTGVNFCIYRQNEDGAQVAQYCIDGKNTRHDLKGDVNVVSLLLEGQNVISREGIYDTNGHKLIDFESRSWLGSPTNLVGPAGNVSSCTQVQGEKVFNSRMVSALVEAVCPEGKILSGGGCYAFGGGDLMSSYPQQNHWKCNYSKRNMGTKRFRAYAVCCG